MSKDLIVEFHNRLDDSKDIANKLKKLAVESRNVFDVQELDIFIHMLEHIRNRQLPQLEGMT